MACEQCNINYANADVAEVSIEQIRMIAKNLRRIGVSIVLLIGGEPFMRRDLPEIVRVFSSEGIHVRMQTNGLASREALMECVEAGGKDISISLDSLDPQKQDEINGACPGSFDRAMRAIADINSIFPGDSMGFFGTVLMPKNLYDIPKVIRFADAVGWGVSLVPAHVTTPDCPRGFRTYDQSMLFPESLYPDVARIIGECKELRDSGLPLYDSDEYLDDIYRYITRQPTAWRRRAGGVCDSPNLYFAIEPDGNLAPCCDYRLQQMFPTYHPDFPDWYWKRLVHREVEPLVSECAGCMYGSYPEMTISARFMKPMLRRAIFFNRDCRRLKRLGLEEILRIAAEIRADNGTRNETR